MDTNGSGGKVPGFPGGPAHQSVLLDAIMKIKPSSF